MHNNLPTHVAIIPDGNRHWARERGLKPWEGHEAGAKNTENLIREARRIGIKHLSFWGSSLENLKKRPLEEKRALLGIYEKYYRKLVESGEIREKKVKINVIGKWREEFPQSLVKILEQGAKETEKYDRYFLNLFLAYSGDDEMVEAIRKIVKSGVTAEKISAKIIKENLMTRELPPVDLLIRTGGEPHLSVGFMMWDIANAQLYFPEVNYPDFDGEEFGKAVEEYQRRERRHGK